ncbi:MAG: LamG-like jellyroll fold domain-containing protein [Bacteroidales bacterium]
MYIYHKRKAFYINGSSIGSTTSSDAVSNFSGSLYVGSAPDGSYRLNGVIDEIFILKGRGLTSNEISALYNSGTGSFLTVL